VESRKRLEEASSERDRVLLKESHYMRQISKLEEQLKEDASLRQERYEVTLQSLRAKQKLVLDQKEDELAEVQTKLNEATEKREKLQIERDSLRDELDKLKDSIRDLKQNSQA